jgi:hypothetical protein
MGLLEGAGILLVGMLVGRFWPTRRQGPRPPRSITPICGCKHELSFHDPKTSQCHAWDKMPGYRPLQCKCRRYTGPEPLTEYYAPEISS